MRMEMRKGTLNMRVELRDGAWSDEVPHEKCKLNGRTYYFAKMPLGDYAIHSHHTGQGYNREDIDFLMTDGSIETVMGPFSCDGCDNYMDHENLAKHLKRPDIAIEATKIRAGEDLWILGKNPIIHYEEKEWVLGDWTKRVKPEWKRLRLEIITVNGSKFRSPRGYI